MPTTSPLRIRDLSIKIELKLLPEAFVRRIIGITMLRVLTNWARTVARTVDPRGLFALVVSCRTLSMNPCRKNVSAAPAIVKMKKANGISQYLLRFRVLLARTATARKRAESPSRKAPWKIHSGISATPTRNDRPPTRHDEASAESRISLVDFRR